MFPEKPKRVRTGRPSGWHFMAEFVDKDGNVFHKGVEQPKLYGSLEPTKVKAKKKKMKRRTKEQILLDRHSEEESCSKERISETKGIFESQHIGELRWENRFINTGIAVS